MHRYNENWQALEVRREISGTEDADPREQYVWHTDYIDSLAVRYYDADTDGNLAENSDGPQYYTQGANYHVHAVVNASGAVLERYHYDPYGRLIVLEPDFTLDGDGVSDIDNPYTFTGRRLDAESGLYYFRNRYYDAAAGRFAIRDESGYVNGENLYAAYYVPHYVDPFGLNVLDGGNIDSVFNKHQKNKHGCVTITFSEYLKEVGVNERDPPIEITRGGWRGCIGVVAANQTCGIPPGPYPTPTNDHAFPPFADWPEQDPSTTCFLSPMSAATHQCPAESPERFLFAIQGAINPDNNISDGTTPLPPGTIITDRSARGDYNYIAKLGKYCVFMDHARRVGGRPNYDPNAIEDSGDLSQHITICPGGLRKCEQMVSGYELTIYCVTCKCKK